VKVFLLNKGVGKWCNACRAGAVGTFCLLVSSCRISSNTSFLI